MPRPSPHVRCAVALTALLLLPALAAGQGTPPRLIAADPAPFDLVFSTPTPSADIYRAIATAGGFTVLFDPQLRVEPVTFELTATTAQEALALLSRTAGHLVTVVDRDTVLVADDTPQKRRHYQHHVLQIFQLQNARLADVMTALRSLVALEHLSADQGLHTITVRDTADKAAIAERLVATLDRPRSEVEVEVAVLRLDAGALARAAGRPAAEAGLPLRLDSARLASLLAALDGVEPLARPTLSVTEGRAAELRLADSLPIATAGGPSPTYQYQEVGLSLSVEARVHPAERAVTLDLDLGLSGPARGADGPAVIGRRALETSVRLRAGESYLLSGLLHLDGSGASTTLGSALAGGRGDQVVLILTPRIVRDSALDAGALAPLWVGTENRPALLAERQPAAAAPHGAPTP